MRAGNGYSHTVKEFVIRLLGWVTIERQSTRLSTASPLRRSPPRRPARGLPWTNVLTAFVRAWPVTMGAVVLLCATVFVAPVWDRAIFMKSLLEALNTNPALMQGL
jgi:hypothetical protein